jgi:DNA-binding MarR family transcriptional regulator
MTSPSPAPALLTGQDVGEAEGALTALLNRTLAASQTGVTRVEYVTLRLLASRGPQPQPAAVHAFLASQPQLGLDRGQVAELLGRLESRGLLSGSAVDGPGPLQLTPAGVALNAQLAEAVVAATRPLYADFDPDDLATAHRVLVELTQRATRLGQGA